MTTENLNSTAELQAFMEKSPDADILLKVATNNGAKWSSLVNTMWQDRILGTRTLTILNNMLSKPSSNSAFTLLTLFLCGVHENVEDCPSSLNFPNFADKMWQNIKMAAQYNAEATLSLFELACNTRALEHPYWHVVIAKIQNSLKHEYLRYVIYSTWFQEKKDDDKMRIMLPHLKHFASKDQIDTAYSLAIDFITFYEALTTDIKSVYQVTLDNNLC